MRSGGMFRRPDPARGALRARRRKASPVLAFFVGALALLAGCSATAPAPAARAPEGLWGVQYLPGDEGAALAALVRPARTAPTRFRVIVVPGSGCAGMGPWAERYFAGLLHASVLVLHKPGVDPFARTAPGDCARSFVQQDRLSSWLAHARAALQADARAQQQPGEPPLPQLLVGISEGAELLPGLAPHVPRLAGLVLLSGSGLDPQEAGALQAQRLGVAADWQAVGHRVQSASPDSTVVQGRSLGYWRDLWRWRVEQPLRDGPWPVLQVWGTGDALVPHAAYEQAAQRASGRAAPWCARALADADHGLQSPGRDGVQAVWGWLEQWARQPARGLCGPLADLATTPTVFPASGSPMQRP